MKGHNAILRARINKPARAPLQKDSMYALRVAAIAVLVGIAAFVGGMYLKKASLEGSSHAARAVDIYSSYPQELPADLIREPGAKLVRSEVTTGADGRETVTVAYSSFASTITNLSVFTDTLSKAGWTIRVSDLQPDAGHVVATKDGGEATVTLIPEGQTVAVTIAYVK